MTKDELARLKEIYEILISGRADLARHKLELLIFALNDNNSPEAA